LSGGELVLTSAGAVWGTLPGWLTLVSLLAVAVILVRGGAGTAVEGLQATNRELQRQIHELQSKVADLTNENAELRGRTDVAVVVAPVIEAVRAHEVSAAKRSDRTLTVLDLIAQRLGKDAEHDRQAGL